MKLHTYFRSSAAYRVRIALNLKGLSYESVPVHLLRQGGEQHRPEFITKNPAQLIPVLEDGPQTITQSIAIMEYLEEAYPERPLLPVGAGARAYVRSLALSVACDVHPLNNLRVMQYLQSTFSVSTDQKTEWTRHWINVAFTAIEQMLTQGGLSGLCCFGDTPTIADCCLIPQVFNARRFGVSLQPYPTISRVDQHCTRLTAFERAAPGAQPDAE